MSDSTHSFGSQPPAPNDVPPQVTARYEVFEKLGEGGMGVVYRGRHRQLDRAVAIKLIKSGLNVDRFLREARLLAKVDSPYVVRVFDFDILSDGTPMFVMELIEGCDLRLVIQERKGPLDEGPTRLWMLEVAEGLLAAAKQGIVHRDVKPSNIRIDLQDHARVIDFGLSRLGGESLGAALTQSGSVVGTCYYMAPEQAESPRAVDTRSDIYAYGATFYHALTGRPPFEGETNLAVFFKHKTETPALAQSLNPYLSRPISELLQRCLAKAPEQRYSSFNEIIEQLRERPKQAVDRPAIHGRRSSSSSPRLIAASEYIGDDEPIPGYRLIRNIARGFRSGIWIATDPAGEALVLKITDGDPNTGLKPGEWQSIAKLFTKNLQHRHLLLPRGAWVKDWSGDVVASHLDILDATGKLKSPPERRLAQLLVVTDVTESTLSEIADQHRKSENNGLPLLDLLRYTEHIASGLDYLHGAGLIHRDIKPANIHLRRGDAVLGDFQLLLFGNPGGCEPTCMCTPAYASHEVLTWRPQSALPTGKADQYSLAVTYYELRCGCLPYAAETINDVFNVVQYGNYDLSRIRKKSVGAVLRRALSKSPDHRYSSCTELVNELKNAELGGASVLSTLGNVLRRARLWSGRPDQPGPPRGA
jgi:serine/threonine protein kinase